MVFVIVARNTCSTREKHEGNVARGHWHNTNLLSHMFSHIKRGVHPLQMYKKRSLINFCCVSSTLLYMFIDPIKEVITKLVAPTFFFPCYRMWYVLKNLVAFSFSTNFILASKWKWTLSTRNLIGVMRLVFPYLMKPFSTTKLDWFRTLLKNLLKLVDDAFQHLKIQQINRQIIVYNKETLANRGSTMWSP